MAYPIEPHDIHGFKIDPKGSLTNCDIRAFLILHVDDSGKVSGVSYGKENDLIFIGRAWRDDVEKRNVITIEIPPNGGG